jgi:hypothetical protein
MKFQKVEEAMTLYTMSTQNPLIASSRPAMQLLTEDVLRAMDGNKVIPLIQPPPEPPGPPPSVPHWQEDANFLRGQDQPVNPMDDDDAHIDGHTAFRNTPAGQALDPTQAKMHDQHIRFHVAQRLDKTGAALQAQMDPRMGAAA